MPRTDSHTTGPDESTGKKYFMYLKRIVITSRNQIWYFWIPVITGSTGIHFRSLQIAISCKNFSFFFIFVGKLFPYYRAWRIYWCQNFYCFAVKIAKTKWIPDLIVNSRNTEWIYTETKLIVSSKRTSRYLPITRYTRYLEALIRCHQEC